MMGKLNEIIEWNECGSEYRLYVRHYPDEHGKRCINIVFEDATHDKVTEIHVPNNKLKQVLTVINGDMLSRKYDINV